MARYKHDACRQAKMLPVRDERQILPGTFAHTLSYLIDAEIDLSAFTARHHNDETGAPAYDPAILLKSVLFAYSQGILSSRKIAALCCEHVGFMALSAGTQPHFTTMADFISSCSDAMARIFRDVLPVCDEAGRIGREMFAVDGVKRPCTASKEWSGTRADLTQKAEEVQRAVARLRQKHRLTDAAPEDAAVRGAEERRIQTLQAAIRKIEACLATREAKLGRSGKPIQRDSTGHDSATRPPSKGVVPGYAGAALAEARHRVIGHSGAFGAGQEHGLLIPMLEGGREPFGELGWSSDLLQEVTLAADAGSSRAANAQHAFDHGIEADIAATNCRQREPRFTDAGRHKPTRPDEPCAKPQRAVKFPPKGFQRAAEHSHAICPAGKRLDKSGGHKGLVGLQTVQFRAPRGACRDCPLRAKCRRHPKRTKVRQGACIIGRTPGKPEKYLTKMKRKLDSELGRYQDSRRLGIIGPVFGNLRHPKGLTRLTLRGRRKVNPQWQRFCLGHNSEKSQRYGRIARAAKGRGRKIA